MKRILKKDDSSLKYSKANSILYLFQALVLLMVRTIITHDRKKNKPRKFQPCFEYQVSLFSSTTWRSSAQINRYV